MQRKQKNSTRFIKINPKDPESEIISQAVRVIRQGGVVVFPTRSLYGLAADARDDAAVRRIFEIKHRPLLNPLLVLIKDRKEALLLAEEIPAAAACLMDSFWPGKITLVLRANPSVRKIITSGTGRIGIRVPGHPVAAALVNRLGVPITGTSANISGGMGCSAISELNPDIAQNADLILDAGRLAPGNGSTVVVAVSEGVRLLREGAVSAAAIESVLGKNRFKLIDNSD